MAQRIIRMKLGKDLSVIQALGCKGLLLQGTYWKESEWPRRSVIFPYSGVSLTYLSRAERARYAVSIGEDLIVKDAIGNPLHLIDKRNDLIVMGPDKNLYIGKLDEGRFHHSSFFAGVITTNASGKLTSFSNMSGHYKPTEKAFI